MGDKKKHKDKDKKRSKKKRQHEKKSKKQKKKSRSSSSSSSSSDSSSEGSSRERSRNKKKTKNDKMSKQKKIQITATKPNLNFMNAPMPTINNPTGFVPSLPGMPSIGTRAIPPPPANQPATAPVPKIKMKQINIFKILPKLPYGCTLLGMTLYSKDLIQDQFYNQLMTDCVKKLQKTAKQENNKKAISLMNKCLNQFNKIDQIQGTLRDSRQQLKIKQQIKMNVQQQNKYIKMQEIYRSFMCKNI